MDFEIIAIGLFVGIIVGATSTGGGALLTPALILIAKVPASIAIGSDVLIASGMKLFGGGFYISRREVNWETIKNLTIGSIPGAMLGIFILNNLPISALDAYISHALGIVLILAGTFMALLLTIKKRFHPRHPPRWSISAMLGFFTGLLVSMTSIGSGSLLLCVLSLLYPFSATTIIGTDIVHALFLALVATVGHSIAGRVDIALATTVLLGAIPGVLIGAKLAISMPERILRASLAIVLIVIGIQLTVFNVSSVQVQSVSPTAQEKNML